MHEVNGISPPVSIARFFLTLQLIHKSKLENHKFSLEIFVAEISIARNLHLSLFEKKHFSYISTHILFWIRFRLICVAQNQRRFEDEDLIKEVRKISEQIND